MDTIDTGSQRNVEAIVDEDSRPCAGGKISHPADEIEQFPDRQILFAHLDHVDMITNGTSAAGEDVALTPVGNVVADHSAVGRLTIFNDFQKTASSKNPSRTSTTPKPGDGTPDEVIEDKDPK